MAYAEVLMCSGATVSWTLVVVCGLTGSAISRIRRSFNVTSALTSIDPRSTDVGGAFLQNIRLSASMLRIRFYGLLQGEEAAIGYSNDL